MAATEGSPDLTAAAEHAPGNESLAQAYRLAAELFVNPEQTDRDRLLADARETVVPVVANDVGEETADSFRAFLAEYESMSVGEFVATHELSPSCPLYLGHYAFDEPETCREVSEADRNQYMVELNAIYDHYGFELESELADFLPAMVEFCWLTLPEQGDDLRTEYQRKLLALLPAMRERFAKAGTPYRHLLDVIEGLLRYDIAGDPAATLDLTDIEDFEGISMPEKPAEASGGEA